MVAGDEEQKPSTRSSIKSHIAFNNYPKWKDKLRENCYKRVRADRTRLLWKMRLPGSKDLSLGQEELIKSTFQDIVSEELGKFKETPMESCSGTMNPEPETSDDMLWEYDGLHAAYQGECEEILLEMQKIFYEDLKSEKKGEEADGYFKVWEDEEDEYSARAVFENMQLNDNDKVQKAVWCPVCKQGELQQRRHLIFCPLCELKLNGGNGVTLEFVRERLGEAHGQHFDSGCRLNPKFSILSKFGMTALYIKCHGCDTFEIVI